MFANDAKNLAKMFLKMESEGVFERVRAATVLEGIKLSQNILGMSPIPKADESPAESNEYRKRSELKVGEVFLIDKIFFMAIKVPEEHLKNLEDMGFGHGSKNISAVIGGAFSDAVEIPKDMIGRICGGYSDNSSYQVVPYSLLETGVVKPIINVEPGEMFIHGDDVFLRCLYERSSYVTTLDGYFMEWDKMSSGDVTILKPEFQLSKS